NINEIVLCEPKDNAGFLGYIIAEHKDPKKLKHILMDLCESVVKSLKIVPLQEKKSDFSLIKQLREDADKEQVKVFDCTYIQPFIETWWNQLKYKDNYGKNKEQLKSVLLENFTRGELHQLNKVGVTGYHISAIFMIGLFTVDDPDLAYIVHEALSDLAQIRDIRYPYEDHKKIFIKPEGVQKKEWGNGAGAISPHCDDLYEEEDTDLLSLTTCRDTLKGSTLLFMAKQIFSILSDTEMDRLTKMIAIFISGINVNGTVKEKKRPVLSYKNSNFFMALDYRVDESTGARMRIKDESDLALLEKIKMHLTPDKAMKPKSEVGNFVILSNSKVLHAREALQAVTGLCSLDLDTTPRLLFRSKGPRY
ncbi:MAG: hypothetical protein O7C59_06620, partial [Rickettsia endosymbiont of Ixodes persulcatus]|nr:hypothetical protein [Rickettsia endosymbiont of Ixodes persulcatus]